MLTPLYWAGVEGVMFFVRCVGVRVHVKGIERIPRRHVHFRRKSHQFRGCARRGVAPSLAASPFC